MHFSWSYAKRETSFIHCFGDSNALGFCFNLFLEPTGAYQLCYFPAQGVLQFRHLFMVRIHFVWICCWKNTKSDMLITV